VTSTGGSSAVAHLAAFPSSRPWVDGQDLPEDAVDVPGEVGHPARPDLPQVHLGDVGLRDARVKCAPGTGPPEGRRHGTATKAVNRECSDENPRPRVLIRARSVSGDAASAFPVG
jgi:hypothetical protein